MRGLSGPHDGSKQSRYSAALLVEYTVSPSVAMTPVVLANMAATSSSRVLLPHSAMSPMAHNRLLPAGGPGGCGVVAGGPPGRSRSAGAVAVAQPKVGASVELDGEAP